MVGCGRRMRERKKPLHLQRTGSKPAKKRLVYYSLTAIHFVLVVVVDNINLIFGRITLKSMDEVDAASHGHGPIPMLPLEKLKSKFVSVR